MVVIRSMGLLANGAYIPTVSTCFRMKHSFKEEGPSVSGTRRVNAQAALSERHPFPYLHRVPFITLTR